MYQSWYWNLGNLIPEFFKSKEVFGNTDRIGRRRRRTVPLDTVFQFKQFPEMSTYQVPGAILASADTKKNKQLSLIAAS